VKFNLKYFTLAVALFITEVLIALYLHDAIIRPYGGDFLVVILIYCLVKAFFNWPVLKTAIGTLIFSYLVEIGQYFHLVNILGLEHSKLARTIIGVGFSFIDLICYTLGIILVLMVEGLISKRVV
jgi:hypothetical protein